MMMLGVDITPFRGFSGDRIFRGQDISLGVAVGQEGDRVAACLGSLAGEGFGKGAETT